jgi:hypothetical protein
LLRALRRRAARASKGKSEMRLISGPVPSIVSLAHP